ncbi:uncharacterized protein LOC108812242 [Raphanus sativus]|uniref:Uncharacterized protein LOC108812242 n=1 Tax=Raphanus sativus TaxID=3726 RepID=A0A6J0JW42_RAPSA|nr:uncharacterized protein LOC108812242 [Raphanus sativus]
MILISHHLSTYVLYKSSLTRHFTSKETKREKMGNCLRHESETHWSGEDWDDDFITEHEEEQDHHHSSKTTSIKAGETVILAQDSKPSHHEIKIRLTKKQLQNLLNQVNVHDLTGSDRKTEEANHHRLWTPVLHSIPEV